MAATSLTAPSLAAIDAAVVHAFSTALYTPADHAAAFAGTSGLAGVPLVRLRQVHGRTVVDAEDARRGRTGSGSGPGVIGPGVIEGDALVGDRPGVALAVAHADCVPILLADASAGVIGAVHAGWRGMVARVLPAAIEAMAARGADPGRIHAAIGPAVQGSCYEVGPEVRAAFERVFAEAAGLFAGSKLDLVAATRAELSGMGVPPAQVSVLPLCTHCRPELASYRREGAARGTNLAAIALRSRLRPTS